MAKAKEKAFYTEVSRILWEEWDPIGVNDGDNTWDDEYNSYAPHVYRLALEGKDAIKIASALSSSAEQSMGLSPSRGHDLNIAKLIVKKKQEICGE